MTTKYKVNYKTYDAFGSMQGWKEFKTLEEAKAFITETLLTNKGSHAKLYESTERELEYEFSLSKAREAIVSDPVLKITNNSDLDQKAEDIFNLFAHMIDYDYCMQGENKIFEETKPKILEIIK